VSTSRLARAGELQEAKEKQIRYLLCQEMGKRKWVYKIKEHTTERDSRVRQVVVLTSLTTARGGTNQSVKGRGEGRRGPVTRASLKKIPEKPGKRF